MSDPLVPDATVKAAKRGFIRTASQSVATALAGGITVNAVLAAIDGGTINPTVLIVTAAVAVVTPIINGAQSYFSILGSGIPDDYKAPVIRDAIRAFETPAKDDPRTKTEQYADRSASRSRLGLPD